MYSYEAEQKKLQALMDEYFDMSDEDIADPFADYSEDEYVPSENESERSDDDDTPVRKMQKTEHPPTTSTKISNLYSDTIEAVVADYEDISSPEDYSEDEAAPGDASNLVWNNVTGKYLKKITYSAVNTGVIATEFEELSEKTPYDFLKYFVTDEIISYMVEETNRYAFQTKQKENLSSKSRLKQWKDVDVLEMEKFLGILFWMGLNKMPKITDYWSKNPLYKNEVKNVMSRNRFELILRMWHFSDNEKCPPNDRLFKIQPFLDKLLERFQAGNIPQQEICIDETLVPFRGRLAFKQYIKNKRHKFGIKLFKLCIKDGYTYNMKIYCGREAEPGTPVSSSVVLTLMKDLLDSGRILYTDNYYTSIHLAHELLIRSTHLVGTLRSNRKLNPKEVTNAKLKRGQQVARESNTGIVVLKWRDKRDVLVLSTVHTDSLKSVANGSEKPDIIIDYNNCKSFIDLSDQMKSYSTSLRRGIKWFRKLAVELITGSALVNAHVLYRKNTGEQMNITKFKEQVALKLLHIEQNNTLAEETLPNIQQCRLENMGKARRRCVACYEKLKNEYGRKYAIVKCKQSAYKCIKCNSYFCVECFFANHDANANKL